jgi:hypothetical protein
MSFCNNNNNKKTTAAEKGFISREGDGTICQIVSFKAQGLNNSEEAKI